MMTSFLVFSMRSSQLVVSRRVVRRPRPSDPWFDADCRAAKRLTRRLERAFLAASRHVSAASGSPTAASASVAADAAKKLWYDQKRSYRKLRSQKYVSFWSDKLTTVNSPRDVVYRRSTAGTWTTCLRRSFCEKVERIRLTTSGSSPPTFCPTPVSYTHLTLPTILRV